MSHEELTDEELLAESKQCAGQQRDSLVDELFRRHYQRVARWSYRFTGNREGAADLAQDVFLKAHRHLASFRGTSRFSTWLYTITRNEAMNRIQRAAPPMDNDEVLADVASLDLSPDDLTVRDEQGRLLHEFLTATLDPLERQVFTLHYGDEMPIDAITRLLGLENASGAKAYIVSARRKLAKAKERRGGEGRAL